VRQVTGKPIKFIGMGEKIDALEAFHPERMASRILGMGDVVSLVEEATRKIDHDKAARIAGKIKKGKGFDLDDLREQLMQVDRMGGLGGLLDKLPGGLQMPAAAGQVDPRQTARMVAIINSMTPAERRSPDIIRGSRKRRIASGSGTEVQDVNRLLKQFTQMQKMMKQMKKGGLAKMARSMGGRFPGLPM
jgi:signal recognition particle subunit SRP54